MGFSIASKNASVDASFFFAECRQHKFLGMAAGLGSMMARVTRLHSDHGGQLVTVSCRIVTTTIDEQQMFGLYSYVKSGMSSREEMLGRHEEEQQDNSLAKLQRDVNGGDSLWRTLCRGLMLLFLGELMSRPLASVSRRVTQCRGVHDNMLKRGK
jgi:hypothetical protein